MSDQSRQLRIEPLEQRIVLGVIVSAGEFFQYLDADGDLQRIYVDAGRIDIDGIEDPGLNDTIDTLTVLDEGTDFDSSAITITEVQANGVANFTAEFGVDVTQGMDTSVGKTGTIDVLQANASGAIITVGTGVVDGNVNTFRMNTGSWSGTLTVEGDITTVDIADDIAVAGQIAADQITTLNVTDDVLGTVETAAGGAITNVTADEVSGTISAGTGVNRGDISSLTLGTVSGGGQIV
ncbi:MAG: hypothetical protein JXL80_17595, partial [Planctomycetes bacterium]|nr:hypothetical protein [Planctomycetota bacterium]